jgi:hypothetical protein
MVCLALALTLTLVSYWFGDHYGYGYMLSWGWLNVNAISYATLPTFLEWLGVASLLVAAPLVRRRTAVFLAGPLGLVTLAVLWQTIEYSQWVTWLTFLLYVVLTGGVAVGAVGDRRMVGVIAAAGAVLAHTLVWLVYYLTMGWPFGQSLLTCFSGTNTFFVFLAAGAAMAVAASSD